MYATVLTWFCSEFAVNYLQDTFMARKIQDAKLESRTSRQSLVTRNAPYWARISAGLALGYLKGKRGGSWVVKLYDKDTSKRYQEKLATADDILDENGADILSFDRAQEKAREWREGKRKQLDGDEPEQHGPFLISLAIENYLEDYQVRSGKSLDSIMFNINAHILPAFGHIEVSKLTQRRIKEWHRNLAETPARLRTRPGDQQRYREVINDTQPSRSRKSTANKILTTLKAALNFARSEGHIKDDQAWASVKPFKNVEAAKIRYLSDDESNRLVNACPTDLRDLVTAALLTGARYGELSRLRASDFNPDNGKLYVEISKSDKDRHIVITDEGRRFFSRTIIGKKRSDLIFLRSNGSVWGRAHQYRPLKEACKVAQIEPTIGFHILRHTYGSRLAMRGVPMAVIAEQLGHADTRVTEKHYAHLGPSYVADTVRRAFDEIGLLEDDGKVVPIKGAR
jgi:integrase